MTPELLSQTEEALWRAVMRIFTVLPSQLDTDLVRGAGLTASEYVTLLHLSDAPHHELRMTDLARATGLSASRTTRLVDDLQGRDFVTKLANSADARSTRARLTSRGTAKLGSARQIRLQSVRRRFFDHVDSASLAPLVEALGGVADQLEDGWKPARYPEGHAP
jgi:DNA-binding MarR family transcriptional regulator